MILETVIPAKKIKLFRVNNPKVGDIVYSVRGFGTKNQYAIKQILLEKITQDTWRTNKASSLSTDNIWMEV
jgi:hypothetical protein